MKCLRKKSEAYGLESDQSFLITNSSTLEEVDSEDTRINSILLCPNNSDPNSLLLLKISKSTSKFTEKVKRCQMVSEELPSMKPNNTKK